MEKLINKKEGEDTELFSREKVELPSILEKINNSEMKVEIDDREADLENLEKTREKIDEVEIASKIDKEEVKERINKYIDKNLPEHLKKNKPTLFFKLFKFLSKASLKEVVGKENLPEDTKLFISNHRGGETGRIIAALDAPVHIVTANKINWERSGILRWIMKKLEMTPINESFSNLSKEQKIEAVERSPKSEREAHQKVAEAFPKSNAKNIRAIVAILLKGGDVAMFAEGPFSRLEEDERRAYAGYALIAREYKKITKKDLNIIPTGVRNSKVSFGEAFHIDQAKRQSKEELQDVATEKIHVLYNSLDSRDIM